MVIKLEAADLAETPYKDTKQYRKRRNQRQGKRKEIFVRSLKSIAKEYCLEASISGLRRIVERDRSVLERAIWAVVMVVSLACSITLVLLNFQQFENAPLVTTQLPEGVSVSKIVFPAISICTTNRISKEAVTQFARMLMAEENNDGRNEKEMLKLLYNLGDLYDLESESVSELMKLHSLIASYDIRDLMFNLTPSCDEILMRCLWEQRWVKCSEIFEFRLTMNGFCCTFNYMRQSDQFDKLAFLNKKLTLSPSWPFIMGSPSHSRSELTVDMFEMGNKSSFGYDLGLKVLLHLRDDDDFYLNQPLLGALVTITDPYDFPDATSGSLRLQILTPETQTSLLITTSITEASPDIRHIPVELRGCLFYDESSYLPIFTNSDCLLKCRALFMNDKCGCIPFNVPKMEGVKTCNLQDVPCLYNYTAQSMAVQSTSPVPIPELELELVGGGIPCPMCYPTCSKTVYTLVAESVNLFPRFLNEVPDIEREPWLRGINFTMCSILHVKHGDEKASAYGQNIVMKWFDLVSNIGSTCGFVTGFSFVSLLEFLYFFTFKLYRKIRSQRQISAENKFKEASPKMPSSQPIYWAELGGPLGHSKAFTITGSFQRQRNLQ